MVLLNVVSFPEFRKSLFSRILKKILFFWKCVFSRILKKKTSLLKCLISRITVWSSSPRAGAQRQCGLFLKSSSNLSSLCPWQQSGCKYKSSMFPIPHQLGTEHRGVLRLAAIFTRSEFRSPFRPLSLCQLDYQAVEQ